MPGSSCARHTDYTARCPACQTVSSHYARRRRTAIANGTWQHAIPAHHVRAHIDHLRQQGMTVTAIARAAGLSPSTVHPLAQPGRQRQYVQGPTGNAILAVQPVPEPPLPAGRVNATGTGRRVRALVAAGYSLTDLTRRLGRDTMQPVWEWAYDKQPALTVANARAVADLYQRIDATPGPSARARNHGRRHGWPLPIAWDSDTIDDPDAQPTYGADVDDQADPVLVEQAAAGRARYRGLNDAERVAVYHQLVADGCGPGTIQARLRINSGTYDALVALATTTDDGLDDEAAA